jgi:hypothetical protein
VATSEFIGIAKDTAMSQGAMDASFVVVPHPMGMIPLVEIRKMADNAFPEILKAATAWQPKADAKLAAKPPYPAATLKFKGTGKDVNDLFFKNGWSLGVPIIPPTPERVAEMLKGTRHKPDEVVGLITPRMGVVTVEMVAVHAVMAGCKPGYMPVLLAITEALVNPEYRGPTTTTNPTAPLAIVNGPIRDQIGLAYGQGAAGPEWHANVTIGLAVNSIGDVIGGSKPPTPDKTTLGWPGNTIAMVFGENEKSNPWDPLHEERGFKKNESVVHVMLGAEIPSNINDHDSVKGEDLLRVVAYDMRRAGQNTRYFSNSDVLVILSPEHAATLFNDGWKNKAEIKKYLWENARIPLKAFPGGGKYAKYGVENASKFLGQTLETFIPMVKEAARIQIAVSGGSGKHSQYVSSFGEQTPRMHSISIDKWR